MRLPEGALQPLIFLVCDDKVLTPYLGATDCCTTIDAYKTSTQINILTQDTSGTMYCLKGIAVATSGTEGQNTLAIHDTTRHIQLHNSVGTSHCSVANDTHTREHSRQALQHGLGHHTGTVVASIQSESLRVRVLRTTQ